jgi:hypothetical protein
MMNKIDWNLWDNITFKTLGYRKNFDMVSNNENIITQYDGMINEVRILTRQYPRPVGEYNFSVWNIELGKKFGVNIYNLIKDFEVENTYGELVELIREGDIDIEDYKKIVFVNTMILNKDYRKRGITQEFIEMLYRDFYDEGVAIIMLVKPFQDNTMDVDYYLNHKAVALKDSIDNPKTTIVSGRVYYGLNELVDKTDTELNEYKLFNVASKCGFSRIDESHLFLFSPEKTIERLEEKINFSQEVEFK